MPGKPSGLTLVLLGLLALAMGGMAWWAAGPETRGAFVAAALASGALCALIWKRGDVSTPLIIGLALVFRLAVFWLPPTLSDDAYRYVWDGLAQAEGHNPYLHAPDSPELEALREEPLYDELNSTGLHTVYPPVSQLIFRIGAALYDQGWMVSWFVIKGILALFEFGAVLVLGRMLAPRQLLIYAWNPAVVMAGAGQGHSEAAMVLFLALALLALKNDRGIWASVWLSCAGGVKLYPFLLLPFVWRRFGWKSVAASLGIALLPALPFLHFDVTELMQNMGSSLHLYVRLFEFNAGLYYLLKYFLMLPTGLDLGKLLGPALAAAYLAGLGMLYAQRRKPEGTGWKAWAGPRALLREEGSLRPAFVWAAGGFLVCATTVHPWYLLGVLALAAPAERPAWHWYALSICSLGTYLLYTDGPYWLWVWAGWGGWTALAAWRYRREITDLALRVRGARKAARAARFLQGSRSVLDVGAAEGYVGLDVAKRLGAHVRLVDIRNRNRTVLPHDEYDGERLPYPSETFDAALLIFVLHHADKPEALLRETLRVSRRAAILESTWVWRWEWALLRVLDRLANRLRRVGEAPAQEETPRFQTHEAWMECFREAGLRVVHEERTRRCVDRQSLFVVEREEGGEETP